MIGQGVPRWTLCHLCCIELIQHTAADYGLSTANEIISLFSFFKFQFSNILGVVDSSGLLRPKSIAHSHIRYLSGQWFSIKQVHLLKPVNMYTPTVTCYTHYFFNACTWVPAHVTLRVMTRDAAVLYFAASSRVSWLARESRERNYSLYGTQ